ncbi:ABC transporter substrate binding protein [Bradyrhizobium sp.]|uniref:ABC transporter substrate binding protein n=1 Tax=Bradyrhizobium sp. TaxID=376 RepID=UPI003BB0C487
MFAVGGGDPARVAKAATSTIPIAFVSAADPVKTGLVVSLNRPEGNVTGASLIGSALEAKRLELLEVLPGSEIVCLSGLIRNDIRPSCARRCES